MRLEILTIQPLIHHCFLICFFLFHGKRLFANSFSKQFIWQIPYLDSISIAFVCGSMSNFTEIEMKDMLPLPNPLLPF